MDLYGLLGYPLGHSFSAAYFTEKFSNLQIDARYCNFEYNSVEAALAYMMQQDELKGFNVTIPYKEKIIPYLSELSADAAAIGAVNVVKVIRDGNGKVSLKGYNSDYIGFVDSIKPLLHTDCHRSALVLGTGGASRAIVYGLRSLNLQVQLVSRRGGDNVLTYDDLNEPLLSTFGVIVNCTPLGMYPDFDDAPPIPYKGLTPKHLLYDLVYNPLQTRFMSEGLAQGAVVKNGLEMLHLQAEAAWKIWNDRN